MSVGKRIAIICSLLVIAVIGVLGYIYYPAIQGLITDKKYYTQDDVQNSYDDGYKDGFETENELKEKLSYYTTMVDEYQVNIEALNLEVARITKLNQNLQVDIQVLEDTKAKNISTIAELTDSNKVKDETISSLNADIEELNTEIGTLTSEITRLETEKENLQGDINELNTQIAVLNSQLDGKNKEIEELNKTILTLEEEIDNNNIIILDLEKTNANLNQEIKILNTDLANAQNQITELNNRVSSLEKSVSDYENYIAELEGANLAIAIFEFDNSVYEIKEVDENGFVSIDNPISTEYLIFNYWTLNGEQVDLSTYKITKNTKFVADITYKYKVEFKVDNEIVDSQIITKNENVSIPAEPVKDKFNFIGWSVDGYNVIDIDNYIITSDTLFTAVFNDKYGLFNSDTGKVIYSWDELLSYKFLQVDENNVLSKGENVLRLSGDLKIIDGITSIADSTFNACSGLARVFIPEGVTTIGSGAFYACFSLIELQVPSTVTTFGNNCFSPGLSSNTMKISKVNYLGNMSQWCNIEFIGERSNPVYISRNLYMNNVLIDGTITIPSDITEIKSYTFNGFNNEFILLNNVTNICEYAFFNSTLTRLDLPSSMSTINSYAFNNCSKMEYISVPRAIKTIGDYAFKGCSSLKSFDFSGFETIGTRAFENCSSLTEINLPNTITSLGNNAFNGCLSLVYIYYDIITLENASYTWPYFQTFGVQDGNGVFEFGSSVKHIPGYILYNNHSVSRIIIPENVETATPEAIYGCDNVQVVDFYAKNLNLSALYYGDGLFASSYAVAKGDMVTLNIYSSVERLNQNIFVDWYELNKVNWIGTPSVTYIGSESFGSCDSLTSFFIPISVVEILSTDGRYSPWGYIDMPFVLYCEFETAPSSYGSAWNYYQLYEQLETKYGYTYDEYLAETQG